MEAKTDLAAGRVQPRHLSAYGPLPIQAPLAGLQLRRGPIGGAFIGPRGAGRKILTPAVAQIGFVRCFRGGRGGGLCAFGPGIDRAARHIRAAALAQQLPDHAFRAFVFAFAKVMVADAPLDIDEVMRRPKLVVERLPDGQVVVLRHRIGDAQVGDCPADIGLGFFEGEFRRVHADHHQPVILVLFRPGFDIGQGAQTVDAGIGPEIHQHHLAPQLFARQWRRIQPLRRAGQFGQLAFHRKIAPRHGGGSGLALQPNRLQQRLFNFVGAGG